jgi:long-subunit fatty acid transport protein
MGTAYLFNKNLQVDIAFTTNNKETPKVNKISIGLSYRFDFHKDKVFLK